MVSSPVSTSTTARRCVDVFLSELDCVRLADADASSGCGNDSNFALIAPHCFNPQMPTYEIQSVIQTDIRGSGPND